MSYVKIPYDAEDDFDLDAHRRTVAWVEALGLDPYAIQKASTADIIPINNGASFMVQFEEFIFEGPPWSSHAKKKRNRDGTAITHTITVPMIASPADYGLEIVD